MNVQHVCRRFVRDSWGGTESAVLSLAHELMARGHGAEILTSMALSNLPTEKIEGVTVRRFHHFYPYLGLGRAEREQMDLRAGNLFSYDLLREVMFAPPPDVFHLHTGKRMGGIVRLAARHHHRPYVISLHGGVVDVPAEERARWTAAAEKSWEWGRVLGAAVGARRVLEDADAILCVNREEQLKLQAQFPQKRVYWTPNTVETERYRKGDGFRLRRELGIGAGSRVLLNVARLDEQKNQMLAIEILERVAAVEKDVWLLLIGPATNPDYAARLRQRVAASPCGDRIRLLGNIAAGSERMVDLYHAADAFLLTSTHEPFGIVLLEAWAAGLPIVAARVGGIPSFVQHRRNGLMYTSNDASEAASLVTELLAAEATGEELRRQALLDVARFDARAALEQTLEIYREVQREHPVCA